MSVSQIGRWFEVLQQKEAIVGKVGNYSTSLSLSKSKNPESTLVTLAPLTVPSVDGTRTILYQYVIESIFPTGYKIASQAGKSILWNHNLNPVYSSIIRKMYLATNLWQYKGRNATVEEYTYESPEIPFLGLEKAFNQSDGFVVIGLNVALPVQIEWEEGMLEVTTILQYQHVYAEEDDDKDDIVSSRIKFKGFGY